MREYPVVVHGEIISLQIGSPVCILIGELDRVEFAVSVVDLAGEVGNQYLRHIGGIVGAVGFLAEVLAFGGHVHVMAVEHLLNPLGLLHGKPSGLDFVLLLVLLVVERGYAVRDGDKAKALKLHTAYTENGTPYYVEADVVLECRTMYAAPFDPQYFKDDVPKQMYSNFPASVHTMYIGEVVNAWKK